MKHIRCHIATLLLCTLTASLCIGAERKPRRSSRTLNPQDSVRVDSILTQLRMDHPAPPLLKRPVFIGLKYTGGEALVESSKLKTGYTQYADVRMGVTSLGNRWKDIVYGMPYYGIGAGYLGLNSPAAGDPFYAYALQGATLKAFSSRSFIKYEWNFGVSFNWRTYNPEINPGNECISRRANVYFGANLFYTYLLSKDFDLNVGVMINHTSNGAMSMPNSGINTATAFVSLTYFFERERIINTFNPFLRAPVYDQKRLISDFTFNGASRQRKLDRAETGLSSQYIDKNFFVGNLSYAIMHMPNYKFRYGSGVDLVYDESAGFTAKKVGQTAGGADIAEYRHGSFGDRLALGLFARGDVVMPRYSVSLIVGYEVIQGKKPDNPLYQAISIRAPFWDNLYGAFTIRSQRFSKAQYMFFGLGYMIDHRPFRTIKR